jgi:hypothetical protein
MYIDPNTGGMLFQILAAAFAIISGAILFFSGRIRMFFARMRRRFREGASEEHDLAGEVVDDPDGNLEL